MQASPFEVADLAAAKRIILTGDPSRWEIETPYLVSLLVEWLDPRPGQLVLDFGCGVGRLARPLLERCGCSVLGLDTSPSMQALALAYVGGQGFALAGGLPAPVDLAYAVWALQHVTDPDRELRDIALSLSKGGRFLLVNERGRFVPEGGGWANDGKNVLLQAQRYFQVVRRGSLSQAFVPQGGSAYWALLERL